MTINHPKSILVRATDCRRGAKKGKKLTNLITFACNMRHIKTKTSRGDFNDPMNNVFDASVGRLATKNCRNNADD